MFPQSEQKENHGDDKVTEAIDKVLKKIFGPEATLLIYEYLENRYSIRQNEIVEKINVFAKGLEEFLKSGAYIIEMKILVFSRKKSSVWRINSSRGTSEPRALLSILNSWRIFAPNSIIKNTDMTPIELVTKKIVCWLCGYMFLTAERY